MFTDRMGNSFRITVTASDKLVVLVRKDDLTKVSHRFSTLWFGGCMEKEYDVDENIDVLIFYKKDISNGHGVVTVRFENSDYTRCTIMDNECWETGKKKVDEKNRLAFSAVTKEYDELLSYCKKNGWVEMPI